VTTAVEPGISAGSGDTGHDLPPVDEDRTRRRLHLFAVSVALTVLTFVQASGRIAPDTKADLSIDPLGFLLRAWHLWEPLGDSGQLQNQAYGYFLPMGPFYALGHLLGLPAWMVQRAWWALILLVAFHGTYRLCRAFGVGNHPIQIIAALTFALSPRMITEVGPVSIEAWPMAMAPWVLLPLVRVRPGSEVTTAARSGLAVALCGGVNAVAVGAVLPLPLWWLMTREPGPLRRKLIRWWALAVVLATFWWVAPLLLLGQYSPPFLDWIESSAASTSKAALPSAFRGTTQWVAWFQLPRPIWLAGWSVLSSPAGILLGWLLITLAVLAMLRRDMPHRRFLLGASLGGLVLLTLGHTGPLTAPWAGAVQEFLDGPGAPLRNTHKFDLILRLPMALALAHAMSTVRLPAIRLPGLPVIPGGPQALRFVVVCALVGSAAPALVGQLPARGSFEEVPGYWRQAATWLDQNDDGARTLIVPGSTFATSVWGDPHDEPFQALARTKWATRSGVPLSSAGNIRLLNVIEQQLETGRGSAGLAEFLSRAGISRVLVRADLVRAFQAGSPPTPVVVRSALQTTPGMRPVARFGPDLAGGRTSTRVVDDGTDVSMPAIEIWSVGAPARLADVYPADSTLRVRGGPESLLALAEANRLGSRPTVLADDPEATALAGGALVDTDTIQRREADFGQVRDNYSEVMTPGQPYRNLRRVHDWLPFAAPAVTARYEGVSSVESSSEAGTVLGPWYAFDGDGSTSWTSTSFATGQWLEARFPAARPLPASITITPGQVGAEIVEVAVTTDAGRAVSALNAGEAARGLPQVVQVPPGLTSKLRITVTKAGAGTDLKAVSINAVTIPGITPARPLALPPPSNTQAPAIVSLHAARDGADACMFDGAAAVCSSRLYKQSQDNDIDRIANLALPGTYTVQGTARIRATTFADRMIDPLGPAMTATASSRRTNEPATRPQAAVDRDPGTAWMAAVGDSSPFLDLRWPQARRVDELRWQVDPALTASRPNRLRITAGSEVRDVRPNEDGEVRFRPLTTNALRIQVTGVQPLSSYDRASGFIATLPVGASEIVVPAADTARRKFNPAARAQTLCGFGPELEIAGRKVPSTVVGTAGDVLHRLPMAVIPCTSEAADGVVGGRATPAARDGVPDPDALFRLPGGQARLRMLAGPLFEPQSLTLASSRAASTPTQPTVPERIREVGPEHRVITVAPASGAQVLVVHENANPGWRATLDGQPLASVRIDGWQQGWLVPAGSSGDVDLLFTPGRSYRLTLVAGLLLVGLLVALTVPQRRRRTARALPGGRLRGQTLVVALPESGGRRVYGLLGLAGVVSIAGLWGIGAVLAVLVAVRARVQMRYLIAGAGAVAGVTTAFSVHQFETSAASVIGIAASLVVLACMCVRFDAAVGGWLGRLTSGRRYRRPQRRWTGSSR
jgi:arabinofuranan 3-O-arabinosyltransferase